MTILRHGTLLENGRYRIDRVIGHGGFGITYLGEHVSLGRKVAIKEFFMKEFCNRDNDTSRVYTASNGSVELVARFRAKFLKEANNLARFHHPNIVSVTDVFEENGTAYYVMEYHAGGSLADKVKNGPLAEADAVKYIRQVALALEYIHSMQVMHLDIKPANILLDGAGNAVLIDFGLAKQYDSDGHQTSTTPVGLSHGYAPMEQYKQGGVSEFSPVSDIYSLGATLYKLVTGLTPPDANDIFDRGLPQLPASLSVGVRSAIEKAMQPRRVERPQSIGEFLALLGTVEPNVLAGKHGTEEPVVSHDENVVTVIEVTENNDEPDSPTVVNEVAARGKVSGKAGKYLVGLILLLIVAAGGFFVYNGFIAGSDSSDSLRNFVENKSDSTATTAQQAPVVKTPGDFVMLIADVTNSAVDKFENASSAEEVVLAFEEVAEGYEDLGSRCAGVMEACGDMDDEDFEAEYPYAVATLDRALERLENVGYVIENFEYTAEQEVRIQAAIKKIFALVDYLPG